MLRKEDGEIPKATLLWNPQGSRKRGRPKSSWRRSVIKEAGRSWNELRFLAADRSGTCVPKQGTADCVIIITYHVFHIHVTYHMHTVLEINIG
jgi:hypothetical protein